jgi:nifR3 family TIM-barrel protein
MSNIVSIGPVAVPGRVWIAPMTGITDLPFRRAASALGAAYVATEMVVSDDLAQARPEAVRRAAVGAGLPLMVVQLVGADPALIARGAALAAAAGAQVVDLNFGCPARSVTGVACGSALMRDLGVAERLIAAAVNASPAPVTVKMRLGWDAASRNAPELAARAQAAGASALTVHGRTRAQLYGGTADWEAVAAVKAAVSLPVIVNGDIIDTPSARRALAGSGADAVMIGRGALGRPWIARTIEAALEGREYPEPGPAPRRRIVLDHLAASVAFHGPRLGVRVFRKHLAAYVDAAPWPADPHDRRAARIQLCRLETEGEVIRALTALWLGAPETMAA